MASVPACGKSPANALTYPDSCSATIRKSPRLARRLLRRETNILAFLARICGEISTAVTPLTVRYHIVVALSRLICSFRVNDRTIDVIPAALAASESESEFNLRETGNKSSGYEPCLCLSSQAFNHSCFHRQAYLSITPVQLAGGDCYAFGGRAQVQGAVE